jgi:hypothetical protein
MGDPSLPTKEEGDEQFSCSDDNREEGDDEIGAVDGIVGDANANERYLLLPHITSLLGTF